MLYQHSCHIRQGKSFHSTLCQHYVNLQYEFDFHNTKNLYKYSNHLKRIILKSVSINLNPKTVNAQTELDGITKIYILAIFLFLFWSSFNIQVEIKFCQTMTKKFKVKFSLFLITQLLEQLFEMVFVHPKHFNMQHIPDSVVVLIVYWFLICNMIVYLISW